MKYFFKKKDHDSRAWDWEDKNKSLITNGETEFFFNSKLNKKNKSSITNVEIAFCFFKMKN